MAKKLQDKKSIQELLDEAQILYDKIPYEVPENWCWVKLGSLISVRTGKKDANFATESGNFTFFTCAEKSMLCDEYSFDGEALLLPGNGANVGKVLYFEGKFEAYQRTYVIQNIQNNNKVLKYIFYNLLVFWNDYNSDKQYGNATNFIRLDNILNYEVPLAPLEEQKRIVEIIESLFFKLDEAKEKIQNALDSYSDRRARILHAAFTGDLTKQWREKNSLQTSFRIEEFAKIANIKCNLVEPANYHTSPHIAPNNIEKFTGKLLPYKTIQEDGVISGKHKFHKGQILYSKIRPNLSKVIIANFDGLCSADMYPIEAKENTQYLWYYMLSSDFLNQATTAGSRTVLPKINQKELSTIKIALPSIPEQTEIVRILDSLLEKEDKSNELLSLLNKIDEMKKSILARAFRSKLNTHNQTDQPAIKLLKKILEERTNEN